MPAGGVPKSCHRHPDSAFSYIPTERTDPPDHTVYNNDASCVHKHLSSSGYDRQFHSYNGYNNKLHRDDRQHAKSRGLHVNEEETIKGVPSLSSSVYGKLLHMHTDHPTRKHVRIAHVKSEFYRKNDINVAESDIFMERLFASKR